MGFLKKYYKFLKNMNPLIEFIIVFMAYWISTVLRYYLPIGQRYGIDDSTGYMMVGAFFALVVATVSWMFGDYFTSHIKSVVEELFKVARSTFIGLMVASAIIYLLRLYQFSRVLLFYTFILSIIGLLVKRIIVNKIAKAYVKKFAIVYNVLMIGSGRSAMLAYHTIFKPKYQNMNLFGYLANEENDKLPGYLGKIDDLVECVKGKDISVLMIADEEIRRDKIRDIVIFGSNHGMRVCIIPEFSEFMPSREAISQIGGNYLLDLTAYDTCEIMGVNISVTNMEKTVNRIKDNLKDWKGKYICVSNVHTTVTASESEDYRDIQNNAVIALPDGGPLSAFSREQGYRGAARVTGPDLMKRMLVESEETGYRHFFYGSTKQTLDKLKKVVEEKYPGAVICGMISPPFRPLTVSEDMEVIKEINEAKPDFVWVGLGAPKQEIWMSDHEGKIDGLMIGVGAAFDYESGNIKRAPMWMQKRNLEWLYRLIQDPKRLFRRYFVTNTKYLMWKYRHGGR